MSEWLSEGQAGKTYSEYYALEATGHRIAVMVCLRCGTTVLLGDPDVDAPKVHDAWHRRWDQGGR